jgi:thiamine monophosphate synthase
VHSNDEIVRECDEGGVDYLLFGTVFPTQSKPGRAPTGIPRLIEAVKAANCVPVLAVGGVTPETMGQLTPTGCAGFAAIGQFADVPVEHLASAVTAALHAWDNPSG